MPNLRLLVAMLWHDPDRGIPWQALFWVGVVACLGMAGFYAVVWASASGDTTAAALRGLLGCARAAGYILAGRLLVWMLLAIFHW